MDSDISGSKPAIGIFASGRYYGNGYTENQINPKRGIVDKFAEGDIVTIKMKNYSKYI